MSHGETSHHMTESMLSGSSQRVCCVCFGLFQAFCSKWYRAGTFLSACGTKGALSDVVDWHSDHPALLEADEFLYAGPAQSFQRLVEVATDMVRRMGIRPESKWHPV